jgi:serine/threonine protein kinase
MYIPFCKFVPLPVNVSLEKTLFGKIRRGQFNIPQMLSVKAKCMIKNLLRRDPSERLAAGDILQHLLKQVHCTFMQIFFVCICFEYQMKVF